MVLNTLDIAAEHFTSLDNLNLDKFAYGSLGLGPSYFSILPVSQELKWFLENNFHFKSGQKRLINNNTVCIPLLGQIRDTV